VTIMWANSQFQTEIERAWYVCVWVGGLCSLAGDDSSFTGEGSQADSSRLDQMQKPRKARESESEQF